MIGYYVHHVGHGHARRALGIAQELADDVTGLSSLPAPTGWTGSWISLTRDDDDDLIGTSATVGVDVTASDRLHWVPRGHRGLRTRMARIAGFIEETSPAVLVSDVSVEVALLGRLLGVPVVSVALPGSRSDPAHRLGWDVSDLVLCPCPESLAPQLLDLGGTRTPVCWSGSFSRYDRSPLGPATAGRHVVVLQGAGGDAWTESQLARAAEATPCWAWTVLGPAPARWVDDPRSLLCTADVVVTHAGLGALGEVAALRRPAVVIPQERPHDEQHRTGRALAQSGLAVVAAKWPAVADWPVLLERAQRLGGGGWARWSDGAGAERAANAIAAVAAKQVFRCA